MSKIIKFCSMFCVMLFTLIFCTSCASINHSITINLDGSRVETFSFDIDKSELENLNIDVTETMDFIDEIIDEWVCTKNLTTNKFYTKISSAKTGTYSRTISISFANYNAYCIFYGITTQDTKQESVVEEGFFYDKSIIYNGTTEFDNITTIDFYNTIAKHLADNYYSGDTSNILQYFNKIQTTVSRQYPAAARVHSNADKIIKNSEYSLHTWKSNLEADNNSLTTTPKTMYIYQSVYNDHNIRNWYLIGIVCAVIFGIILAIVLIYKNKSQQHTNIESNQNTIITQNNVQNEQTQIQQQDINTTIQQENNESETILDDTKVNKKRKNSSTKANNQE